MPRLYLDLSATTFRDTYGHNSSCFFGRYEPLHFGQDRIGGPGVLFQEPLMSLCIRVNTREKGTIETLLEKIDICEVLDTIGAYRSMS